MMRGQVFRYIGWQFVDRAGPRLFGSVFVTAAFGIILHLAMKQGAPPDEQFKGVLIQLHQQLAFIYVLFLMHGIVSIDRVQGFYRFYLAKPASPTWFYGQSVVLAFIASCAASASYVLLMAWLVKPVFAWEVIPHTIALFAIFGMLMFVFGTVSRHDWLWAIVAVLVASVLRNRWPADESMLGKVLRDILPPNQFIGSSQHPTAAQWTWVAAWAVGLFALGLVIMRARPVGED